MHAREKTVAELAAAFSRLPQTADVDAADRRRANSLAVTFVLVEGRQEARLIQIKSRLGKA